MRAACCDPRRVARRERCDMPPGRRTGGNREPIPPQVHRAGTPPARHQDCRIVRNTAHEPVRPGYIRCRMVRFQRKEFLMVPYWHRLWCEIVRFATRSLLLCFLCLFVATVGIHSFCTLVVTWAETTDFRIFCSNKKGGHYKALHS